MRRGASLCTEHLFLQLDLSGVEGYDLIHAPGLSPTRSASPHSSSGLNRIKGTFALGWVACRDCWHSLHGAVRGRGVIQGARRAAYVGQILNLHTLIHPGGC